MVGWHIAAAAAWESPVEVPLEQPVRAAALADVGATPALVLTTDTGLVAVDLGSRVAVARTDGVGAIAVVDLDGDGRGELLQCGPGGVAWWPTAGGVFGRPKPLSATPCDDMSVDAAASWPQIVVRSGDTFVRLGPDGDGALRETPLGLTLDGEPRMAWSEDAVVFGRVGGRTLVLATGDTSGVLPTGGPLVDLAGDGDGLVWVVGGDSPAAMRGAWRVALEQPPHRLELADIDGDGVSDVLVAGADGWIHPPALTGLPVGDVVTADADGDGVHDLYIADGEALWWVRGDARGAAPAVATEDPPEAPPVTANPSDNATSDAGWPPKQWLDGPRVPYEQLPPPAVVTLDGGAWAVVTVYAGQPVDLQLAPRARVHAVDGLPTMRLAGDVLHYAAPPGDIGVWRVSVRDGRRWDGFVLEVWPRPPG